MLDLLRKTLPKTKVVAVGLLPRGEEVGPKSFNRVVRPLYNPEPNLLPKTLSESYERWGWRTPMCVALVPD